MIRGLLELLRILIIFAFLGGIFGWLVDSLYRSMGLIHEPYIGLGYISVLLFLFILYRNKWQFGGWYEGKGRRKLSKTITWALLVAAVLFFMIPPGIKFLI